MVLAEGESARLEVWIEPRHRMHRRPSRREPRALLGLRASEWGLLGMGWYREWETLRKREPAPCWGAGLKMAGD